MTTTKPSLTDAERARDEYRTYVETAYKIPSMVADARRKKYEQRDPQGREAGTITEEEENDDSGNWSHDRRRKEATVHKRDPVEEEALSDGKAEEALSDCDRARNEYIDRVISEWKTCGR